MRLPDTDAWIRQAQIAHAAESPRWQYIFGRYEAGALGGAVMARQATALHRSGFERQTSDAASLLIGPGTWRPTALGQLRHGTASAALAGGISALKRMNETTKAYQRLAGLFDARRFLQVPYRLGPLQEIAQILKAESRPLRLLTSRPDEVVAYRAAGLELIGQEGVASDFTVWLIG